MDRQYRNSVVKRLEKHIGQMQHPESGVTFRSQKLFLSTIPAAISGADFISWLTKRLLTDDVAEAITVANLFCYYGYVYPLTDYKSLVVKDDPSVLYRFQAPYFWLSKVSKPDAMDYAIYLVKRSLRGRQKYSLEEYEQGALDRLQKMLCDKWEFIYMQAEEQVRLGKERKKTDRTVINAQERAFWRIHRPPPGRPCRIEEGVPRNIPLSQINSKKEALLAKQGKSGNSVANGGIGKCKSDSPPNSSSKTGATKAIENLIMHNCNNSAYDWFIDRSDTFNYWLANSDTDQWPPTSAEEGCFSTVKQVRMWATNFDCLLRDSHGKSRFEQFLEKEFSAENLRFWTAVYGHKFGPLCRIIDGAKQIYAEFLGPAATSEINVDSRTLAITEKELKTPSRFTFEEAQDHIYTLMKNDSYVRFLRSDDYASALRYALEKPNQGGNKGGRKLFKATAPTNQISSKQSSQKPADSAISNIDEANNSGQQNRSPAKANAVAPWDDVNA